MIQVVEKVNIVAHSKGGLDARWYIAHGGANKVANLIMIGTPNSGSPAAWMDITGCPFDSDSDLFPGHSLLGSRFDLKIPLLCYCWKLDTICVCLALYGIGTRRR